MTISSTEVSLQKPLILNGYTITKVSGISSQISVTNGLTIRNDSTNSGAITIINDNTSANIILQTAVGSTGSIIINPKGATVPALTISSLGTASFSNPITLPTNYNSTAPAITQLGGYSQATFNESALTTNTFKSLGSINLPVGVYIINLTVTYIQTQAGALTRYVIEASPNSSGFQNNLSQSSSYMNQTIPVSNGNTYSTSYTVSATISQNIYGNCLFTFSGSASATGSISYTRIG
jgi:hypothetical protein